MKLIEVIRSLLPLGTNGTSFRRERGKLVPSTIDFDLCPVWPPDIFAVAGVIIEKSGCYTLVRSAYADKREHKKYLQLVARAAKEWRTNEFGLFVVPDVVQNLWTEVISRGQTELLNVCRDTGLVRTLLKLFAIADEACVGMGWEAFDNSIFADVVRFEFIHDPNKPKSLSLLKHAPYSVCGLVPPDAAIVLPKTLTATVGCTLRSLSHHLALLPGSAHVKASWTLGSTISSPPSSDPVNLLVVPFPFKVDEESFYLASDPERLDGSTHTAGYFGVAQTWLKTRSGSPVTAQMLNDELLSPLIEKARSKAVDAVHGLVLPECALSEKIADDLATILGDTGIDFFVVGVLSDGGAHGRKRNIAKTYIFDKVNRGVVCLVQSKHHRWRLTAAQNKQYGLNFHTASNTAKWWEDIDVGVRSLPFFAFRKEMSMAVLICEDLARSDPAMPVIRAVGPNLVLALLMDGPQLPVRWPGRYATVLADDPGSAVLTVTCAGMVDRSNFRFRGSSKRIVALWRDADENEFPIELERESFATLISLRAPVDKQHTLDARSDNFSCRKLTLDKVSQISIANAPDWL
ncbi:hypothetical protein EGT07_18270 [Herbaspirillum sp. HC18]|nr:hypothetical protein EGT07_18270 [Herbaspirillum sp. HC18]